MRKNNLRLATFTGLAIGLAMMGMSWAIDTVVATSNDLGEVVAGQAEEWVVANKNLRAGKPQMFEMAHTGHLFQGFYSPGGYVAATFDYEDGSGSYTMGVTHRDLWPMK